MLETNLHCSSRARLPPAMRTNILSRLTEAEADALIHDWRFWARPEQVAPTANGRHGPTSQAAARERPGRVRNIDHAKNSRARVGLRN